MTETLTPPIIPDDTEVLAKGACDLEGSAPFEAVLESGNVVTADEVVAGTIRNPRWLIAFKELQQRNDFMAR